MKLVMNSNKHDLKNSHENVSLLEEAPPENIQHFLSTPYHVTNEHIRSYEKNGFVKLEQVITPDTLSYFRNIHMSIRRFYFKRLSF